MESNHYSNGYGKGGARADAKKDIFQHWRCLLVALQHMRH